jgi:hypothetical protein
VLGGAPPVDGVYDPDDIYGSPEPNALGRYFTRIFHELNGFEHGFAEDDVAPSHHQPHLVTGQSSHALTLDPFSRLEDATEVDQAPARSSQSYPDVENYADLSSSGWEEVDGRVEQLCAANKEDLTLLRASNPHAGAVTWRNGYKTFLPWRASNDPQVENARADVSLCFLFYEKANDRTHSGRSLC